MLTSYHDDHPERCVYPRRSVLALETPSLESGGFSSSDQSDGLP
jgi:hypothetical protein